MRSIVVSGYKNSGKTAIVDGIVENLSKKGYRVGTIKHVPHSPLSFGDGEADTKRHLEAGSEKTVALGSSKVFTLEKREADLEDIFREMRDLDFVIGEGFKNSENVPRIIVAENDSNAEELEDKFTVGFVGAGVEKKPRFEKDALSDIADLVEEKAVMPPAGMDCGECGYDSCRDYVLSAISGEAPKEGCVALSDKVKLLVDGKRVPLKPFIQDLVERTVTGMITPLKETEGKEIEIKIERDED